jgi:hypothetical protein
MASKAPRFDKILLAATYSKNSKTMSKSTNRLDGVKLHPHLAELIKGRTEMKMHFPNLINPKEFK